MNILSFETKKIILSTGSVLDSPDISGLKEASLTFSDVLEMSSLPESILVWGSGPVEEVEALIRTRRSIHAGSPSISRETTIAVVRAMMLGYPVYGARRIPVRKKAKISLR